MVGGGPAGTVAALQAARAGAKAVLLEMGSQLGGTTTTGGVAFPGLFHAWGKQVIGGIGWELVQKAVELDGGTFPDFSKVPPRHSQHQVRLNGQLYAALVEEACLESGVSLAYYQFPLSGKKTADGWTLDVVGKGVRYQIAARQLVDCTGGADIVAMLGFARLREETTQPGTLIFRLGGYDAAKLDAAQIQRRYQKALAAGELEEGDYAKAGGQFISFLRGGGTNAQHVFGADSSTAVTKTQANIAGRRSILRLLRFVRSLPGCEKARVQLMMQETAVRETYRIAGETMISCDDYTSGRVFEDAVCYSFYPIDLHDRHGVRPKPLTPGTVPTVPLGALAPKGSRNLLVAGRLRWQRPLGELGTACASLLYGDGTSCRCRPPCWLPGAGQRRHLFLWRRFDRFCANTRPLCRCDGSDLANHERLWPLERPRPDTSTGAACVLWKPLSHGSRGRSSRQCLSAGAGEAPHGSGPASEVRDRPKARSLFQQAGPGNEPIIRLPKLPTFLLPVRW